MTQLYDNFAALAAGSAGAPSIVDAAVSNVSGIKLLSTSIPAGKYGASSIAAPDIATDAVGNTEIVVDAVHQGELKTAVDSQSAAIGANTYVHFTPAGGFHTLAPFLSTSSAVWTDMSIIPELGTTAPSKFTIGSGSFSGYTAYFYAY